MNSTAAPIDPSAYCVGCGQKFRPSLRRASHQDEDLKGRDEFCLWCHIQDYRAHEIFDDPLECEAEIRAKITACDEAKRDGWRFRCDRVRPRKRAFVVSIVRPDGSTAETLGEPAGAGAWQAQQLGEARMVWHATAARQALPISGDATAPHPVS